MFKNFYRRPWVASAELSGVSCRFGSHSSMWSHLPLMERCRKTRTLKRGWKIFGIRNFCQKRSTKGDWLTEAFALISGTIDKDLGRNDGSKGREDVRQISVGKLLRQVINEQIAPIRAWKEFVKIVQNKRVKITFALRSTRILVQSCHAWAAARKRDLSVATSRVRDHHELVTAVSSGRRESG